MAQKYAIPAGMTKPSKVTTLTPQSQPIAGREAEMIVNPAGAYSFEADSWARLNRFLTLGVSGNSIYQSKASLVTENADLIASLLNEDGVRVVEAVVDVLGNNRALRVDAGFYTLAMAASSKKPEVAARALAALSGVVRTPTHLFMFIGYVNSMRGWGRALRRAVASYYTDLALPKLAMHAWKYKNREGWSHRDVLRLSHATATDPARNAVLRYMAQGKLPTDFGDDRALAQIVAADTLSKTKDVREAVKLITDHRLTREAVPTELLNEPKVWDALLQDMPLTAMIRNLGKLAAIGMTGSLSDAEKLIVAKLSDQANVEGSRIHPMQILIALKQYSMGRGNRGSLTWNPNGNILDALDSAFYMAFGNVETTGKRLLLAVDDSGSMRQSKSVMDGIMTPHEASAAMVLVNYMVEPNSVIVSYSDKYREITMSRKGTVMDLSRKIGSIGAGTDTALPVQYALDTKKDFDAIVSYTDNNTWAGGGYSYYGSRTGHVTEVLRNYQNKVGHPVRFINASMEANRVTDVDPKNPNMFEVSGMDSSTPQVISEFIAGRI